MALDFKKIERKWQTKWEKARLFEAEPILAQPKYFITYPYPYMNGYLHIGHSFTLLRCELLAWYKRMKGFNVLFPFAFHCTGTPILAAAARIKAGEKEQIEILKDMGISQAQLRKFEDPVYWTKYFPKVAEEDLRRLGASVDWRRKFLTTYLNPYYDKFIKWQFRKLNQKKLVNTGVHPVVWCCKCNSPVGDHDRLVGEGEKPQEFTLLKLKFFDSYLVAATLRPETVFGQTNLWVNPAVEYVKAAVNNELWIVSNECADKLALQGYKIEKIGKIIGKELVGKYCFAPGIEREIIILPAKICRPERGTGLVTSVPSDAPDDWAALSELHRNPEECEKHNLSWEEIKKIKPIPIIDSPGWGSLPAVKICEELDIKSQAERKKLEKAKETIYKAGFYLGVLRESCGRYKGLKVEQAKELIKQELLSQGKASKMYELSGEVICRCLTPSVVKLVSDQWFLSYGAREWKSKVHRALDRMQIYPNYAKKQFRYVIDWLEDWACTRELGLGTELPWAQKWMIESLSDSTIYMAYYTISKYLDYERVIDPEKIDDDFFDFVFLGEGSLEKLAEKTGLAKEKLLAIRKEFEYWYPFDCRISGKDLIQNHLTFCLFNHAAIFPEKYWPHAFGVNGWILVEGAKMSKSAGNFYTLRQVLDKYGADQVRFTLGFGGEGLEDPNWSSSFASTIGKKLERWYEFALANFGKGREERSDIDSWFCSKLNRAIKNTEQAMDSLNFRTALSHCYFELQSALKWYLRRCDTSPNKELMKEFILAQTKLLAPFIPHLCEELWEKLGGKGFIALAPYPVWEATKIEPKVERSEKLLRSVLADLAEVLKVLKLKQKHIFIYTAPKWMYRVYYLALKLPEPKSIDLKDFINKLLAEKDLKPRAKEVVSYTKKLVEALKKSSAEELEEARIEIDELSYLKSALPFLSKEFKCEISVLSCDEKEVYDPKGRAKLAVPFRPAIYVE